MNVSPPPATPNRIVDWLFRNRITGEITVAQFPNPPLWIYLATVVARWVLPAIGTARTVSSWIGLAALAWWALDEVIRGVNPWRRMLGIGGCGFAIARAVSLIR